MFYYCSIFVEIIQSTLIMNTKLTLTIQQSVIKKAKKYAKEKGRSLSDLIENYLKSITNETSGSEAIDSPLINSLKGSFKAPEDFDYKRELSEALAEKHLKNG